MSIKDYFQRKRQSREASEMSIDQESSSSSSPAAEYQHLTAGEKRKLYKTNLIFKKEWEKKYPWVTCTNSTDGMFCAVCQKWGRPPAGTRGAWTTKGIGDWNHATELLKQHADSKWHRDAAASAAMAKQAEGGDTVLDLQCSTAALGAQE